MHIRTLFQLGFLPVLFVLLTTSLPAQSFAWFDVDATNFPDLVGEFIIADQNGQILTGLSASDIVLTEDGTPVASNISLSCPPPSTPVPMSVTFVIDRSGSMTAPLPNGQTPLELTQGGVATFLSALDFIPQTAVAITGFNEQAFLVSDFRTSADPLVAALSMMLPEGATLFDPAFLDPLAGGVELLGTRSPSVRRLLIFITDGSPNQPPSTNSIIARAIAEDVEVHTIVIGSRTTADLVRIAQETGGRAYEQIADPGELSAILGNLALPTRGLSPCRIQWRSAAGCLSGEPERSVSLNVPSEDVTVTTQYGIPKEKQVYLQASENFLWFGTIAFPNTGTREIEISPVNSSITITGAFIDDSAHFKVVSWGGPAPPFTLDEGATRKITVEFKPTDTSGYGAELVFLGTPCGSPGVLLAGGRRTPGGGTAPLVLEAPLGGESFDGCDSVTIRWGGVPPEQPVRIQFSNNDGATWQPIADSALGYRFTWFPPEPGNRYRVRVSTDAVEQHVVYTIAGGGDSLADNIFASQARLLNPWGLDVWNDTLYIAESGGRNRVRNLDLLSLIISTTAGTGAPGNGGDGGPAIRARFNGPSDVVVTDDRIYIADRNNYKIRMVDRTTDIVTTIAGTGAIGFTEDGQSVRTGDMGAINGLALDGNYLYVSELGSVVDPANDRVRRIDLGTGIITTIAGGGTSFDSDGASGLLARIYTPQGIAIRDGFLYFTERDGARVRSVNLATGIITTVAGTGTAGFAGDGASATLARMHSPTDILFVKDQLFITEATNGNRIRVVDMTTGIINTFAGTGLKGFGGDSGAARNATFDEPISIVQWGDLLLVSDRFNERIRGITLYRADGLDASDSSFSVVAPRLQLSQDITDRTINLGETGIGVGKDSVLTALICNTGQAPLTLDSARIEGLNAGEFRVTGGMANVPIIPGECRTITVEFTPKESGQREASIIFFGSCTQPDTLFLTGQGLPECGIDNVPLINFGTLQLDGLVKDTTITASFCNNGQTTIAGSVRLASGTGIFTILEGEGPFSLEPNECLDLKIRYTPSVPGRNTGLLEYTIPSTCGAPQTILYGRTARPQQVLATGFRLPAASCPDDFTDTAVVIRNVGELPLEITDLSLPINDEGFSITSTIPTQGTPIILLPEEEERVGIRLAPTVAGYKNARLRITSNDPNGNIHILLEGWRDSLNLAAVESQILAGRIQGATYPRDTVITLQNFGNVPMMITGATLSGDDPGFFAVPSAQFPFEVAAASTGELTLQLLQPIEERSYEAVLNVEYDPTCSAPDVSVRIVHAGTRPVLVVPDISFADLVCDEPARRDTVIKLGNPGGETLRIESVEILNDPEGNFAITASTPIVIPPSGTAEITLSFVPGSSGNKTATLRFTTNTENGSEDILLEGTRDRIAFELSETTLTFDPAAPAPNTQQVTLRNTGTRSIAWNLSDVSGLWSVISVVPPVAGPDEESIATLQYDGPPQGTTEGKLVIMDPLCGTSVTARLRTSDGAGTVELWLPHDSALFNTRVTLPLRYRLVDGVEPSDNDTLETTITFLGTTFFFEELSAGDVAEQHWDPVTDELAITIRTRFGDREGDTLTRLIATGLLAAKDFTPLALTNTGWSRPSLQTTSRDGSFRVLGLCFDPGLHVEARAPKVERIRPNPASHQAVADIVLADWAWVRGRLIDTEGREIEVLAEQYLEAGRHELKIDTRALPKGMYLLRLETPHGAAETPLMIVR